MQDLKHLFDIPRPIPGLDGYMVCEHGMITGPRGTPIKAQAESDGRLRVSIRRKRYLVHKLVMLAWVGPCPEGHQIDHLDGDYTNNELRNLEYVTAQENIRRASEMGLFRNSRKLTEDQVREIKRRLDLGAKGIDLAREYGVTNAWISAIRKGKGRGYIE